MYTRHQHYCVHEHRMDLIRTTCDVATYELQNTYEIDHSRLKLQVLPITASGLQGEQPLVDRTM